MFKKLLKMGVSAYLLILFFPYLVSVFFYVLLKIMAEDGSRLNTQLGKLETDLIQIILNAFKATDFHFLFLNLVGLAWFLILVTTLKRYKILIPRKTKQTEEG